MEQVADLVDDEDVRVNVFGEDFPQLSVCAREREPLEQRVGADEQRFEAVLDRLVGDRDREVCLASSARSEKDRGTTLAHELGAEEAAELREPDRSLEGEVELVDRFEEWEAGASHGALDPSLRTVSDLLGHECSEKVAVGHALFLGTDLECSVVPTSRDETESLKESVEVAHAARSFRISPTHSAPKRSRSAARVIASTIAVGP